MTVTGVVGKGNMVEIADVDVSKAFDRVTHDSLVNKMEICR